MSTTAGKPHRQLSGALQLTRSSAFALPRLGGKAKAMAFRDSQSADLWLGARAQDERVEPLSVKGSCCWLKVELLVLTEVGGLQQD